MRRSPAYVLLVGLVVLAGCGSKHAVPSGSSAGPSVTTQAEAISGGSSGAVAVEGIPASSVPAVPSLTASVEPTTVARGGTITFRLVGADLENWTGGVASYLDRQIDGQWRSIWGLTPPEWGSDAHRFSTDGPEWAWVAIGLPATKVVTLLIPKATTPGVYRVCRPYNHAVEGRAVEEYICAPLVVES